MDIINQLRESYHNYTDKFSNIENGFFVAAALTDFDEETEPSEDPQYGELIIESYGWGYNDSTVSVAKDLNYH